MLTKLWKKLSNLFVSEVRVIRPGSESVDVPTNRKQRRVKASLQRRKSRASVSRSKGK